MKFVIFMDLKNRCMLHGRVFVMVCLFYLNVMVIHLFLLETRYFCNCTHFWRMTDNVIIMIIKIIIIIIIMSLFSEIDIFSIQY